MCFTVPGPRCADVSILSHKLCDPTLEKSHLHESQVTINCENGQLKEYRLCGERHPPNFRENIHNKLDRENDKLMHAPLGPLLTTAGRTSPALRSAKNE